MWLLLLLPEQQRPCRSSDNKMDSNVDDNDEFYWDSGCRAAALQTRADYIRIKRRRSRLRASLPSTHGFSSSGNRGVHRPEDGDIHPPYPPWFTLPPRTPGSFFSASYSINYLSTGIRASAAAAAAAGLPETFLSLAADFQQIRLRFCDVIRRKTVFVLLRNLPSFPLCSGYLLIYVNQSISQSIKKQLFTHSDAGGDIIRC